MKRQLKESKELPTALFISNDSMAIGAMRALQEDGMIVPKDMSIIGFNDSSVAKYVSPSLSTIKIHTEWMGELAVKLLQQLLSTQPPVASKMTIATELIQRESTVSNNVCEQRK